MVQSLELEDKSSRDMLGIIPSSLSLNMSDLRRSVMFESKIRVLSTFEGAVGEQVGEVEADLSDSSYTLKLAVSGKVPCMQHCRRFILVKHRS